MLSSPFLFSMLLYRRDPWITRLNPVALVLNLCANKRLLGQMTWRNIELQHKGSALGVAWSILNPLLIFTVYAFVFAGIFHGKFNRVASETSAEYVIGIFIGLSILQLFLETMIGASSIVVQNANFVKKVVFPLEILPVALLGAALFRCVVSLVLVILAVLLFDGLPTWQVFWLPVFVGCVALLSAGVAWYFAALGVFLRDLAPLAQFFSVLLTFLSATFYSLERVPAAGGLLKWNPLAVAIESARSAVLWGIPPSIGDVCYISVLAIIVSLSGYAVFCALRPAFADVL